VLDGWQQPLLWEAGGPPSYDDPQYLTWFQSGRGHNTVLVDDQELSTDRRVSVDPLVDTGVVAVFSGRHHGYGVEQARTIALVREEPAYVVIQDHAPGSHTFRACWHALHPWHQVGPLAYDASAADAPGLLLIDAGDPAASRVDFTEGVARRPVLEDKTAEYGPLHTLTVTRTTGDFTTVLVPHAGPAAAELSVQRIDGELVVDFGGTVDRLGRHTWTRTVDGRLSWATGWRVRALPSLLRTSDDVDVLATVTGEAVRFDITCTGRCGLWVQANEIRLDGIVIDASVDDAGWSHLTLPYAGSWTVDGVRDE
jgi:hypothetical protein